MIRLFLALGLTTVMLAGLLSGVRLPLQAAGQPPSWTLVTPTGWITQLPVTVSVRVTATEALAPQDVAYQLSTDGGTQWTSWRTEGVEVHLPLSTVAHLTVTQLTLPDSLNRNLIRWRVATQSGTLFESPAFTLPVDTTPPYITITQPTAGAVVTAFVPAGRAQDPIAGIVQVNIQLQDERGRFWDGVRWQASPVWLPVEGTENWTYTGPLPAWEEGVYTITARGVDEAGWESQTIVTVTVDRSPPPPPIQLSIDPADWTSENRFTLRWTPPPDPAGLAGAWYKVGTPPQHPRDGTFVPNAQGVITGIQVPAEGEVPIYVWLEDGLGHVDASRRGEVVARYDATPPGAPVALNAQPTGWQRVNDFSLSWVNPPDLSGIAGAYYRLNGEPSHPTDGQRVSGEDIQRIDHLRVPGEGVYDVYLWLVDRAGNVDQRTRNLLPRAFMYDATPPELTAIITGTLAPSGWYTTPVTVTFQATDRLSGVDTVWYRLHSGTWVTGTTLTLDVDGVYTFTFQARDVAGNQTEPQTVTVSLDQTPPRLEYALSPDPDPSGWYRSVVRVQVQAADQTSGLMDVQYRLDDQPWATLMPTMTLEIEEEGEHTLFLRALDQAGNVTQVGPLSIPVDRAAPITAYLIEGVEGNGNWYISPVTVTLTPTDTASGVVATYFRVDGGPWQEGTVFTITVDGKHEIEFYSVDAAGWEEQGYPIPLWIDTTPPPPPPLVWVQPEDWTRENAFTVTLATPSDLSQVVGAYYKLNDPPEAPDDGVFVDNPHKIEKIRVPAEGTHTLYLWLQDGAGNADHTQVYVLEKALRYDVTPPETDLRFTGVRGNASWWRSPVTVTFAVSDLLSGPRTTFVSLNGSPWEEREVVTVTADGKHTLRYYSVDRAGNVEAVRSTTVRVDTQPPPTPSDLMLVTTGWQRENRFEVRWTPPLDLSGIAGVRYTVGKPPGAAGEGAFSPGQDHAFLQAPEEGIFDVYVWLVDRAGNEDPGTARYFPQALWYDATPPTLAVSVEGDEGENGWFVSPVTIRATATDTVSGGVTVWVQVNGQEPITLTQPLEISTEGSHQVRIWASDAAGNVTPVWERRINIDLSPPQAWVEPLPPYLTAFTPIQGNLVGFIVRWTGIDAASGIVAFDVQVREGLNGRWTFWQPQTSAREGFFVGQLGHTYFFRVRARDAAGHVSTFTLSPYGDTYTHVQVIRNGDFSTGNFLFWQAARVGEPGLALNVKPAEHYTGITSPAAWLGDPIYGGAENPGLVPIGAAVISQTVTVPPLSQMARPTLEFWYHMITWDVMYAPSHQRWQDTFEVRIVTPQESRLILRDGYEAQNNPPVKYVDYAVKHDLGWRRFRYDLTPYAGQTVIIEFSNWNRWDNLYNTYTIVDDIRIIDQALTPRWALPFIVTTGANAPRGEPAPERPPVVPEGSEPER